MTHESSNASTAAAAAQPAGEAAPSTAADTIASSTSSSSVGSRSRTPSVAGYADGDDSSSATTREDGSCTEGSSVPEQRDSSDTADEVASQDAKDASAGKAGANSANANADKGTPPKKKPRKYEHTKEVLLDVPGRRKEIRTTAKGKQYLLQTEGMWSTLTSLTPSGSAARDKGKNTYRHRIRKKLKEFRTFYPFLTRFAKEALALGRWRFLIHLIGSTITGLVPALRMYLSARLISIAQRASELRTLRKGELFLVAGMSYLSTFLETWIDNILAHNNGVLTRRFESMVHEHLMNARSRLDIHTLNKKRVTKDFSDAASLIHTLGDGSFVVSQAISLFTSAMSLGTQASMLWSMTTKENADLALVSMFSSSVSLFSWFWRRRGYTMYSITDRNYNRMSMMEFMSQPDAATFGERKVLGVGQWVLDEYRKASRALGDVSLAAPSNTDAFSSATEAVRTFSDTAIYVLFALKVSELPLSETGISMASLSFIQSAARGLAGSLYRFVREVQSFGSEFASFRAYYRVMEVKSAIAEPPKPREYAKITRTEKGETREGMEIEFKDVFYRWPGKKENALDGISFKINAGELCAICGYNGSGKTTLISLIARLCEPTSGEILINGHPIQSYSPADLHKAMSLLFQTSADLPLSLAEFIGIGDMAQMGDMDKIRQVATESGAIEFIDKLEDGFESSFSANVIMETPETLFKDAVDWDEYDDSDSEDEDEGDEKKRKEDAEDDESGDSDSESGSDSETDSEPEKKAKEKTEKTEIEAGEKEEDDEKPVLSEVSESTAKAADASKQTKDKEVTSGRDNNDDDDKDHVPESGGRLAFSGGQRQKLVMARNFMRTSDLAVFDEYSANLDPVAEHELFKRITANRGKQTLLYITHRYSTVKHADRILVLEKGKVVEQGTHDELMAFNGKYAELSRLALGETDKRAEETENEKTAINTPLPGSRPATPAPPAA